MPPSLRFNVTESKQMSINVIVSTGGEVSLSGGGLEAGREFREIGEPDAHVNDPTGFRR